MLRNTDTAVNLIAVVIIIIISSIVYRSVIKVDCLVCVHTPTDASIILMRVSVCFCYLINHWQCSEADREVRSLCI